MTLRRFLLPILVGLIVSGCSPYLAARNDSPTAYYLRIHDSDSVRVYAVGSHSSGVASNLADKPAAIDLLSETCEVVASWTSTQGGGVVIDEAGNISFKPGPVLGGDSDELKQVYDC